MQPHFPPFPHCSILSFPFSIIFSHFLAMAEEFEECEVVWPELEQPDRNDDVNCLDYRDVIDLNHHQQHNSRMQKPKKKKKRISDSAPVNIPESVFHSADSDEFEEDYGEEGEIVPPHLIIARRISGKMAFSVCTGNGRTLKGRDLSQVRNSILRMTGFLET
ncbi:protein S40-1-like [Malania oleifera]|nr:protein S40-1-like [Malania oleifera]